MEATEAEMRLARELFRSNHYDISREEAYRRWLLVGTLVIEDYIDMARKLMETYIVLPRGSLDT